MPGRPLPAELTECISDLCFTANMLGTAKHNSDHLRQRAYDMLRRLAKQEWYCYELGDNTRLVRPDRSVVHTVSLGSGRLAVGKVIHIPPYFSHQNYIAALQLDIPNPRPRQGEPLLEDVGGMAVHIALPPAAFVRRNQPRPGRALSIIDRATASLLVDKDFRVLDPDELRSAWGGLEYRSFPGESYEPLIRSAPSTM